MSTAIHRAAAKAPAVQRRPASKAAPSVTGTGPVAQLRQALSGRTEVVQMKALASVLQRKTADAVVQRLTEEEEQPAQAKADPAQADSTPAPAGRAANGGLPGGLQSGIESLSGMDMSDVQVHRNSSRPAGLDAVAYAQGNDIHLAPGQDHHLPHEAWHVVQQRQGRVQPTMQMQGVPVNDDHGLEAEADRMGQQAMSTAQKKPV